MQLSKFYKGMIAGLSCLALGGVLYLGTVLYLDHKKEAEVLPEKVKENVIEKEYQGEVYLIENLKFDGVNWITADVKRKGKEHPLSVLYTLDEDILNIDTTGLTIDGDKEGIESFYINLVKRYAKPKGYDEEKYHQCGWTYPEYSSCEEAKKFAGWAEETFKKYQYLLEVEKFRKEAKKPDLEKVLERY